MTSFTMGALGVAILDPVASDAEGLAAALRERGQGVCTLAAVDVEADATWLESTQFETLVIDPVIALPRCLRLIETLRRRGRTGILVMTPALDAARVAALAAAGADLVLEKPVPIAQAVHAVELIRGPARARRLKPSTWTLERRKRLLIAPTGAEIHVSDTDRRLLECFAHARGDLVDREQLKRIVGHAQDVDLNACVYRMRRRVATISGTPLPLRAKSRDGYVFCGAIDLD